MATSKQETGARADQTDRGSGREGYEASVDALEEYQGASLDDPLVGNDDNIIPSPYSQQQLDQRTEEGEGEEIRQEMSDAAEGLKDKRASEGGTQRTEAVRPGDDVDNSRQGRSAKSRKDKDNER
jgi:hypothetical protein